MKVCEIICYSNCEHFQFLSTPMLKTGQTRRSGDFKNFGKIQQPRITPHKVFLLENLQKTVVLILE